MLTGSSRNILLPPDHQREVMDLAMRIDTYREIRSIVPGTPDMVNPSLNEPWRGNVFVDLVHAMPFGHPRSEAMKWRKKRGR